MRKDGEDAEGEELEGEEGEGEEGQECGREWEEQVEVSRVEVKVELREVMRRKKGGRGGEGGLGGGGGSEGTSG